jgi:hypothetical protein
MKTVEQSVEGVNFFNVVEKLKAVAVATSEADSKKLTAKQATVVAPLAGSVVVAAISAKLDEVILALKTAGVIASV